MASQPPLIVVFGLPGTGKTTFARALAALVGGRHLNTDMIRSQMGLRGQYDEATKNLIYEELLRRCRSELGKGMPVVLDGTFYRQALRERLSDLAHETGVAVRWIEILASPETVKERVSGKRPYSEADFAVYEKIRDAFEPLRGDRLQLSSDQLTLEAMLAQAREYLQL